MASVVAVLSGLVAGLLCVAAVVEVRSAGGASNLLGGGANRLAAAGGFTLAAILSSAAAAALIALAPTLFRMSSSGLSASLALYSALRGRLGFKRRVAAVLAVLYLLSPIDMLPDPILVDDIGAMGLAWYYAYTAVGRVGRAFGDVRRVAGERLNIGTMLAVFLLTTGAGLLLA